MQILGLDVCRDTIVGDEMIRGISGGQKKRVTTGLTLFLKKSYFFFPSTSKHPSLTIYPILPTSLLSKY